MKSNKKSVRAAIVALAGIVTIQAKMILLPIFHLTADNLRDAPTPIIAPEMA